MPGPAEMAPKDHNSVPGRNTIDQGERYCLPHFILLNIQDPHYNKVNVLRKNSHP